MPDERVPTPELDATQMTLGPTASYSLADSDEEADELINNLELNCQTQCGPKTTAIATSRDITMTDPGGCDLPEDATPLDPLPEAQSRNQPTSIHSNDPEVKANSVDVVRSVLNFERGDDTNPELTQDTGYNAQGQPEAVESPEVDDDILNAFIADVEDEVNNFPSNEKFDDKEPRIQPANSAAKLIPILQSSATSTEGADALDDPFDSESADDFNDPNMIDDTTLVALAEAFESDCQLEDDLPDPISSYQDPNGNDDIDDDILLDDYTLAALIASNPSTSSPSPEPTLNGPDFNDIDDDTLATLADPASLPTAPLLPQSYLSQPTASPPIQNKPITRTCPYLVRAPISLPTTQSPCLTNLIRSTTAPQLPG